MPSAGSKLLLSLVVGALAAGLLWTAWRRSPREPLELTFFRTAVAAHSPAARAADEPRRPGPLEAERPLFPASAFRRWALGEQEAGRFYDLDNELNVYDPWSHYARAPHLNQRRVWEEHPEGAFEMRTNGLGLRMDAELAAGSPDLRVLVAGDSHTDGVCFNREAFPALLQAALAERRPGELVEVVNTGTGGFGFHNYLGMLERFVPLEPDVFVLTVYLGNDFYDSLPLYHHFNGSSMPSLFPAHREELDGALEVHRYAVAQAFLALEYFAVFPAQREAALQAARDVTTEIQVTCLRNGIRPLVVLLPSFAAVQGDREPELFERLAEALGLSAEDLGTTERMTDSYVAFLRERRIELVDLREPFRSADEVLYWRRDHHLNLAGHAALARALRAPVEAAVPPGSRRVRQDPSAPPGPVPDLLRSPGAPAGEGSSRGPEPRGPGPRDP